MLAASRRTSRIKLLGLGLLAATLGAIFYCLGHGTREVSYMEVLKWHDEMQFMRK